MILFAGCLFGLLRLVLLLIKLIVVVKVVRLFCFVLLAEVKVNTIFR